MDKSKLIADRVINTTGELEIEGVGTIKFRALSRMELIKAQEIQERDGAVKFEQFALSTAMLDPVLTEDEVAAWQAGSPGMEINEVAMAVNRLSGVKSRADKRVVPDVS